MPKTTPTHLVLATDANHVLGIDGALPFSVPLDMQRFRSTTTHAPAHTKPAVLMGYTTWCSLPDAYRPLSKRVNLVLTRTDTHAHKVRKAGGFPFPCVAQALRFVDKSMRNVIGVLYVMGGAQVYAHPDIVARVSTVRWTVVNQPAPTAATSKVTRFDVRQHYPDDVFDTVDEWTTTTHVTWATTAATTADSENTPPARLTVTFRTLRRVQALPHGTLRATTTVATGEAQYLRLLHKVLHTAPKRRTRNSVTRSLFGERLVIDLSDGTVPLLTSKKMAWKTVLRELFWFVSGDTDNATLQAQNVRIWDANASREFLDSRGLTSRNVNDLGPVYGFQWRHAGATYTDCHADYTGKGVDQLEACRQQIVYDPTSRRILFTAWNPSDIDAMALPPCHVLGQWYVKDDGALWLQVYQRSGDLFLGVPFNLFSYAALVHMMAHLTHTRAGGLTYILGDAHIYENHVDAVYTQLTRPTHAPPRFRVKDGCTVDTWEGWGLDEVVLDGYTCEGRLSAEMVA